MKDLIEQKIANYYSELNQTSATDDDLDVKL
jgi:hypothetical protein